MQRMFSSARLLDSDLSQWNVGRVTDISYMFYASLAISSAISLWDISSVQTMYSMFHQATSFNADLSGWNVAKVSDFTLMFYRSLSFAQNLCWNIDSSALTVNAFLLSPAASFTPYPGCLPIAHDELRTAISLWSVDPTKAVETYGPMNLWDTSQVTDTFKLFLNIVDFNDDISSRDVSQVTDMTAIFALALAFNQDISPIRMRQRR